MPGRDPYQTREAWILCFLLGIVMLNFPFIHIFNKETMIFGIPLLFLYFIVGWPASILVVYLFSRTLRGGNDRDSGHGNGRKGQQ